jgi:hypothetical protein
LAPPLKVEDQLEARDILLMRTDGDYEMRMDGDYEPNRGDAPGDDYEGPHSMCRVACLRAPW